MKEAMWFSALAVALIARLMLRHVVHRLTSSTDTQVDDTIVGYLRGPIFWSILAEGIWLATVPLDPLPTVEKGLRGLLLTVVVVLWSVALLRSIAVVLDALSRNVDRVKWIQPKTVPLIDMVSVSSVTLLTSRTIMSSASTLTSVSAVSRFKIVTS